MVVKRAAMYYSVVANAHFIAYNCGVFLVGAMDTHTILYVYFMANGNAVYIGTHHGVEPECTIIATGHGTNNGGIGGYKTIVAENRSNAFNWKNNSHGSVNFGKAK